MPIYYDDNYGEWEEMDDPEMRKFYHEVQRTNVKKKCSICGRTVKIRPEYDKCNRCADMLERGLDPY